tara:strand:+ start:1981 stop:2109 length:129 start_codon:yes stop_codon:yes gene_type:complete
MEGSFDAKIYLHGEEYQHLQKRSGECGRAGILGFTLIIDPDT